jgi:hypothetical protein
MQRLLTRAALCVCPARSRRVQHAGTANGGIAGLLKRTLSPLDSANLDGDEEYDGDEAMEG